MAGEVRGRFLWHELLTTDTRAAQPFYKTVVGWGVEAWDQDKTYQMWMTKTGPVGGIMTLPEDARAMGAPPNWLTYVGTPDVDATVRQATQRGARVLKEAFSIPKVGRMAVLADPQGAVFAAYTPDGWSGPSPVPGMGEFSWHELATTDPVAAFTFYRALFGWDKTESYDMGPELGLYQMYGLAGSGQTMGGIYRKPAEMPAPPNWLPYALVPNADRAADRAKAAGGTILNGPMEVPGGDRIAMLLDPQGAAFAVHSRATAAVAKKAAKPTAAKKGKPARKSKGAKRKRR